MSLLQEDDKGEGQEKEEERVSSELQTSEEVQEESLSLSTEEDRLEQIPLSTPSISMSAGADPWADPAPTAAVVASAVPASKRSGDNPWASNTPDLGSEAGDAFQPVVNVTKSTNEIDQTLSGKGGIEQEERWGEYDLPKLGNAMKRYWDFKPGFLQLNNGSYGACPKPVCDAYKALQDRQEENPDLFRRTYMEEMLQESRSKLAKILRCQADNVVLIANATTGTNAVLRDLIYKPNDAILSLSITYGAVEKNIDYLIETENMRGVELHRVSVELSLPMTKTELLNSLTKAIDEAHSQGKQIRIGILDTIASRPGVKLPWVEMVKILKDRQILSLVDGAHGIGHIPIDLTAADPDFFVSNCHKWMFAHRGCAVFYVASRNFHLQRTSLPTSWFYRTNPSMGSNTWAQQWGSAGTLDVAPFLSVDAALEFRQKMGGEDRIMRYNQDLAIRGGKAAATILDTCVMDLSDNSLACAMVNVQLPIIESRLGNDVTSWMIAADSWFFTSLIKEFKIAIPIYEYKGNIWARLSAQIWLEVSDFEYGARALLELSKRINEGTAPDFRAKKQAITTQESTSTSVPPVDG